MTDDSFSPPAITGLSLHRGSAEFSRQRQYVKGVSTEAWKDRKKERDRQTERDGEKARRQKKTDGQREKEERKKEKEK